MSEVTDLTVIEIKPEQAPVLYVAGGLNAYLEQIRQAVNEVPDLSTKKGRDRVASLAAQVSRSKTAIEKPGQRIETEQRAEREKQEAEARAEREKEEAVAAERRRQEEAESASLAEEQRKAEEEARRAADKEHRRTVNRRVYADLIANGIPEEFAQKAVLAIAGGKVQDAHIKY